MSIAAALVMFAQSIAPQVADAPVTRARPVAVQARASVRIIRPTRIEFPTLEDAGAKAPEPSDREMQRSRDAAGTPWVEFS